MAAKEYFGVALSISQYPGWLKCSFL